MAGASPQSRWTPSSASLARLPAWSPAWGITCSFERDSNDVGVVEAMSDEKEVGECGWLSRSGTELS